MNLVKEKIFCDSNSGPHNGFGWAKSMTMMLV